MRGLTVGRVHAGLLCAWGLAVTAGTLAVATYMARPGDPGAPSRRWPADSAMRPDGRRPTLLIFLHPRCPCSRASLAELAVVLDRYGGRVAAHAVVYRPRAARDGWFPQDLRPALAHRPDLDVRLDPDGEEARRFGVATSGHVLLYDRRGGLIFSGGITSGRGEQGDNPGRAALLGLIVGRDGDDAGIPVFGCPLATPPPRTGTDPGPGR